MDIINYYDLLKTIYFILLTITSNSFCKNYVGCFSVPIFFILLKYTFFSKNYKRCNDDILILISLFIMYIFNAFNVCSLNAIVLVSMIVYIVIALMNFTLYTYDDNINDDILIQHNRLINTRNRTQNNTNRDHTILLISIDEYQHSEFNNRYNEYECSICLEPHMKEDSITFMCSHTYHKDCIKEWISTDKTTCPICKNELNVAESDIVLCV